MTELPSYDELPPAPQGGRSGWGLFGADDNVGLFNLLTPEGVVAAAGLIRKGTVFPLDAPVDAFTPPLAAHRGIPRHKILRLGPYSFDDVLDNFYPQGSSQWDSLGHIGYAEDQFYNGATADDIIGGRRNTMEHWARRGIVGRGVLLDMARTLAEDGRPLDPGSDTALTVDDLELARSRAGIEFKPGDILILHTGFIGWYLGLTNEERIASNRANKGTGIAHDEEMARYLWNSHVSAIAGDTFAVEVRPTDRTSPMGFIHRMLIGQFGMALGELWWTDDLAADCAADGVYEFFFASMPMNAAGAIGSPPNACAIK